MIIPRQIQANDLNSLFAHFVVHPKTVGEKMFHSIGQVTCTTEKLHAVETVGPKLWSLNAICTGRFTCHSMELAFAAT